MHILHGAQEWKNTPRHGRSRSETTEPPALQQKIVWADDADQVLEHFPWVHKSMKWTVEFIFYWLEICMFDVHSRSHRRSNKHDLHGFIDMVMD